VIVITYFKGKVCRHTWTYTMMHKSTYSLKIPDIRNIFFPTVAERWTLCEKSSFSCSSWANWTARRGSISSSIPLLACRCLYHRSGDLRGWRCYYTRLKECIILLMFFFSVRFSGGFCRYRNQNMLNIVAFYAIKCNH